MSDDWKDNKYDREADYQTLDDAENIKYGIGVPLLVLALLACIAGALWGLWGILA